MDPVNDGFIYISKHSSGFQPSWYINHFTISPTNILAWKTTNRSLAIPHIPKHHLTSRVSPSDDYPIGSCWFHTKHNWQTRWKSRFHEWFRGGTRPFLHAAAKTNIWGQPGLTTILSHLQLNHTSTPMVATANLGSTRAHNTTKPSSMKSHIHFYGGNKNS